MPSHILLYIAYIPDLFKSLLIVFLKLLFSSPLSLCLFKGLLPYFQVILYSKLEINNGTLCLIKYDLNINVYNSKSYLFSLVVSFQNDLLISTRGKHNGIDKCKRF